MTLSAVNLVADIQAFDDHLHVSFVNIPAVGGHASDPRVWRALKETMSL